jgi:cardiolipin synthase
LLLIDSNYSLIGSANMDPRSLRLNYELGVELFSAPVNAQLATYFEGRKALSHPVMEDEISKRPLLEQLRDSLAWLFSPYL